MEIAGYRTSARWLTWWLLGVVVYPVVWYLALWPLVPKTPVGWSAWCISGLAFGACLSGGIVGLTWIERQQQNRWAWKLLGFLAVLGFAGAIFATLAYSQTFIAENFSYHGRHEP